MVCAEKIELQRACTSAWESYKAHATEAGIPISAGGSALDLASLHNMLGRIVTSGKEMNPAELSAGLKYSAHLRGEHLKASRALTRHMAAHRC